MILIKKLKVKKLKLKFLKMAFGAECRALEAARALGPARWMDGGGGSLGIHFEGGGSFGCHFLSAPF